MRFPLHVTLGMAWHQLKNEVRGRRRYPFVLMLEPLYTCNLACLGCAVERHTGKLGDRLSVTACLEAVDDCGAPMVSICGGEPTLYPELAELVEAIISRRRHIQLCTNGLLLEERVFGKVQPNRRLTLNVHLDGQRETHDLVCDRRGVYDKAIAGISQAKRLGYRVMTNTTVFKETDIDEIERLCEQLSALHVDGMLISPGYHYESVDRDIFMVRSETQRKFRRVLELSKKYPLASTPLFLEFAAGMRELPCSPWSTVTFTPKGWKGPCYLIGLEHTFDWNRFWNETDWDYWESRRDRRCANCAMHSGFEVSALREVRRRPREAVRALIWSLSG